MTSGSYLKRFVVVSKKHYKTFDVGFIAGHYGLAPANQGPRSGAQARALTIPRVRCRVSTAYKAVRRGCDWNEVVMRDGSAEGSHAHLPVLEWLQLYTTYSRESCLPPG